MFSSLADSMFIMPVCFHPTTVIFVDDDETFLKLLSLKLETTLPILCFNKPEDALTYAKNEHAYLPFTGRCMEESPDGLKLKFSAIRNEIYNPNRFKEILITVTDYDMPNTSGLELIKTLEFHPEISQYSHIILTGKDSDDFKGKIEALHLTDSYIRKDDKDCLHKLTDFIEKRTQKIFQWYSYMPARILSRNKIERNCLLFDGNFSSIFNTYLKENNICELYLFDKQGSYLFLDETAKLSWLFIRNDNGIAKSIELAEQFNAPPSIINALKGKEYILSLYEREDFDIRKKINWDDYMLPTIVFESDNKYINAFPNLLEENKKSVQYYYAFTDQFPDNGMDKDNILSYRAFLASLS